LHYNISKGGHFIIVAMLQQYCNNLSQCFCNVAFLQ